jgi:hypothetical protein
MLKPYAHDYFQLGNKLVGSSIQLVFLEEILPTDSEEKKAEKTSANEKALEHVKMQLLELRDHCVEMDLPVSLILIEDKLKNPPESVEVFQMLIKAISAEIKSKLFLFIPPHVAKYHDIMFQSFITAAFPLASKELVWAGNSLAVGLYTASVFHSMRAAEIGVRVLGNALGVAFPSHPIELAEWQSILDQADSRIVAMKQMPRGTHKDEELSFYSQAAVQFRYFKDAWRVRVAHARETYEEMQAIRIFDHTLEFFETLATRLKEPAPSV